jgi:hypothetical protein
MPDALQRHAKNVEAIPDNTRQRLMSSDYWQRIEKMALRVIDEYPAWRISQRRVQKSGNLQKWLVDTIDADHREDELLKKVLSDVFEELK